MSVFFIASKILGLLLKPMLHSLFLVIASLIARGFKALFLARFLLGSAVAIGLIYSFEPVPESLLRPLENYAQRPSPEQMATARGILVLGGFAGNSVISQQRSAPQLSESAERFFTALSLHQRYPDKPVWFSGFSAALNPKGWSEARITQELIAELGLSDGPFFYEDKSQNTAQNAQFSHHVTNPKPGDRWILLTSASHMKRAHLSFEKAGWKNLILYPVDYQTTQNQTNFSILSNRGYELMAVVYHEYVGLLFYWLSGRI